MAGSPGCFTRRWAVIGLSLVMVLACGCGSGGAPPKRSLNGVATTTSEGVSPSLQVSPKTGLVGGEQLAATVAGFPAGATLYVFECSAVPASPVDGCGAAYGSDNTLVLDTDAAGRASGTVIAQPTAGSGSPQTTVACGDQCVFVAVVGKLGSSVPTGSPAMATAAISFSKSAVLPDLAYSLLADLTWVSTGQGWALALQPCTSGECARVALTVDGGVHWKPIPYFPPAQ